MGRFGIFFGCEEGGGSGGFGLVLGGFRVFFFSVFLFGGLGGWVVWLVGWLGDCLLLFFFR